MIARWLRSLAVLGLLAGGSGNPGAAETGTPIATPNVEVRSGSGALPKGCGVDEVARTVTDFLDAFNRGDAAALAGFFPTAAAYPDTTRPGFQWYSVTDQNRHFVTYDPDGLPAYFAARHEQRERLTLLRLEIAASWHPGVDVVYRLDRQADDLPPHEMIGKGAIECPDKTIFVWSMAQADLEDPPRRATPRA